MARMTPGDLLARNVRAARSRADLGQDDIAERMQKLGYTSWLRQTVSNVERGRRGVGASELYGLHVALEVPLESLLLPAPGDAPMVELPGGQIVHLPRSGFAPTAEVTPVLWRGNEPRFAAPATSAPVAAAIVTSPLGVLLGRRNDGRPPWTFIAGECEAGEEPSDAAVRECKEEAGIEVVIGEVIGERDHPATGRHMVYLAARPARGTDVFVGDRDELAEVRWVRLAEAEEMMPGMFPPVRAYLEREMGLTGQAGS